MGLGSGGSPLYSPEDKIVLLNSTNFQVPFSSLLRHLLTNAMISANHMWFRTSMVGRILLKLVSRHLNHLLKFSHQEEKNMAEKTNIFQVWSLHTLCTNFQAACSGCLWFVFTCDKFKDLYPMLHQDGEM